MNRLTGKVCIVTGAGVGIGRAIAKRFADEGAKVVVASRSQDEIDAVVAAIEQTHPGAAIAVRVDVSERKQVEAMAKAVIAKWGRIDVLVNNAGIMDDFVPVADVTDELWERVMGVNVGGVLHGMRAIIPTMVTTGGGSIINVASIGGLQGARAGAAYTASKHAVIGLSKNTAFMYAQQGIRCNVIAPGGVQTNIGSKMRPHEFGCKRMATGMASNIRMGAPEEIADVAVFLADPNSSLVNGAVITADAGWTAY